MATNPTLTHEASRGRDDPVVTGLVTRARNGERQAWDALVERYAPLIWSICRRHRLEAADAADAAQNVWLKLVDQLDKIRDPAALPGWLATTTRRECGRILRTARRPRRRSCAGRRDHPGRSRPGGRAGPARGRAARGPARGVRAAAPRLPAAARPAYRRSCAVVRRDQRQAGHPGRQHRADPPPLPGQAAPPPGHHRADQRRHLDRHVDAWPP